jgi:hypothetical protein
VPAATSARARLFAPLASWICLPPILALASACAEAEPDAEPAADAPPPLCANVALEINAAVEAKIAAITKTFRIFVSDVERKCALRKTRHTEETPHGKNRSIVRDKKGTSPEVPPHKVNNRSTRQRQFDRIKVGLFNNKIERRPVFANRGECH